jgi:hypothetical protein
MSTKIVMKCKVCADAKKPEKVVTSHFTKNKNGVVVCPTLLEQECRYCHKKGHTVKFCKTLEKNTAKSLPIAPGLSLPIAPALSIKTPMRIAPALSNSFSVLESDEEEGEDREELVEEYPALSENWTKSTTTISTNMSFAKALISEPKMPPPALPVVHVELPKNEPPSKPVRIIDLKTSRWVNDDSSSDEEDDEEVAPKVAQHVMVEDNSAW